MNCSWRHDDEAALGSNMMRSAVADGNPERDLVVPPKAIAWPFKTTIAADSRGVGEGNVITGCHFRSSREGLTAVAGEKPSAGARFAATGVVTSDANGFEDVAAGASSILSRLLSTASVIVALKRLFDAISFLA